jgi:hypothetical protein
MFKFCEQSNGDKSLISQHSNFVKIIMKIDFNLTMFKFHEQNKGNWDNRILWKN